MRETKRQMNLHSFYDHTGIEAHLRRMAEKGWLLCEIGQFFWHYRRIEPKTLTFSVCYFPKATIYDPGPSKQQEEFYDLCAHAGWTLAGSSGQLQVFYNEGENPVPIDTDPALEVDAIHRSAKKSFLLSNCLLGAVGLLNVGQFLFRLRSDPIRTLSNAAVLVSVLAFTLVLLNCVVELASYFLWRRRALKAAARGEFLPTRSHVWLQWLLLAIILPAAVWGAACLFGDGLGGVTAASLIGTVLLLAAVLGIRDALKKKNASAETNRAATMFACVALSILFAVVVPRFAVSALNSRPDPVPEDLPLTVGELLAVNFTYGQSMEYLHSPLLAHLSARQYSWRWEEMDDAPELSYGVTVVKAPFLYGVCKNYLLGWREYLSSVWLRREGTEPIDPAPWGAQEAYRTVNKYGNPRDEYVLCYPDRVVEVALDWTPTPEQMAVIGEKLGWGPL